MDVKQYERVPAELRGLNQWVMRRGKVPYQPTGQPAKSDTPSTWCSFETAAGALCGGNFDGVGFVFADRGIVGVDLDHVIDAQGGIVPWADDIVKRLNSYTEYSPSGTGLHVFVKGDIPVDGKKRQIDKVTNEAVEFYKSKRYFTVTGNVYIDRPIEERAAELQQVYTVLFPPEQKPIHTPQACMPSASADMLAVGLERDKELAALWNGRRDKSDESANDMALMNKLAYWVDCDVDRMVSAFLSSPYASQKDEEHAKKINRKDYLPRTAQAAAASCTQTASQANESYEANKKKAICGDFKDYIGALDDFKFINPLEDKSRYTLDDLGTARLFADTFKGLLTYLPGYKCYWAYRGGVWEKDDEDLTARQYAKRLADYVSAVIPPPPPSSDKQTVTVIDGESEEPQKPKDPYKAHRKHYIRYRDLTPRQSLVRDARDELSGKPSDYDTQPLLFNCLNGTLDLRTMQLQPHNPSDRLAHMGNVSYDPKASCPRFEQFIHEITEGQKDRADMLQKALGYALKGDASEECFFVAIGEKTRNGKGTLFDTVLNVYGSYGAQISFDTIARGSAKDGSRATPDVSRLIGTRLILSNEPEKGVYLNEALLKQLTGNDDITARPLYGDVVQFKPVFKLFITANSKPGVSDDSIFASNRIKLLPFNRHFTEQERDTGLKALFRTEEAKSAILNWLLEGYQKYRYEGLTNTPEMDRLTAEYRKENDAIGLFLAEAVDFTSTGCIKISALLVAYRDWCNNAGLRPLGRKNFVEELRKRGICIISVKNQEAINGGLIC